MGKIITVGGAPGCGKTTLSVKLAQELYAGKKEKVIWFSPDRTVPALGLLFPTREKETLHSVGTLLETDQIRVTDILGTLATTKETDNLGYMGFAAGEHPNTYPGWTENTVRELLTLLAENCDYLVVDCDRNREEPFSRVAQELADRTVSVITPDLRSLLYYAAEPEKEGAVKVMNILDDGLFLPVNEAELHFGDIAYRVGYCRAVRQQMLEGELTKFVPDAAWRSVLRNIAACVAVSEQRDAARA